ncbi:magnesium transporter [Pseudohalioglobus sediminis]|uniref:Magnesium transporter n=1 Tax=Pseudohalioglobus sediminis TaxID=2606449 RepID=A0A5B0X3X3_9GAMM|nr:magnesium transporter [Pseudohalioglobus sediminis]KAA1194024.1 magnesium transporter [Pseudohalioglobus sediminis]
MISHDKEDLLENVQDLNPVEAASLLGAQPSESIKEVLAALPGQQALDIASHLPGSISPEGAETVALVGDLDVSVGEIMSPAIGTVSPTTTVAGAIDDIVHRESVTEVTYFYVVDERGVLLGVVTLRDLLLSKPGQVVAEIMTPEPFSFTPATSLGDAVQAALNKHYRLYPVVDEDGVLQGVIYGWQLFECVAGEINAQTGTLVGLDKEERISTPLLESFRMRHPWLQINLLTAFAAAFVVGVFESTIAQIVALAVFLPVLAGQSGNTGCQALAITLRGITLGELGDYPVKKLVAKEITLGALNGFLVGLVAAAAMWVYASGMGMQEPAMLALVILVAMTGACMCSGLFGVMVPLTLKRWGADPAMASSIFLTTMTDIVGMGLMLALATAIVL